MSEATIIYFGVLFMLATVIVVAISPYMGWDKHGDSEQDKLRKDLLEILKRYIELEEKRLANERPQWKHSVPTTEKEKEDK